MIRYLIKNNIKLMSRNPINIFLLLIMPPIVIAVLSSAFDDLMKSYEESDIIAGYMISEEAVPEALIDAFTKTAEENELILHQYLNGDPEEIIKTDDLCGLVVIKKDSYVLYRNDDKKELSKVFVYFVNAFYENAVASVMGIDTKSVSISVDHPEFLPAIDSVDYYGIIEIVYFAWNAIICGAAIFISEKKNGIFKKFQVTSISESKLYLGKLISITAAVGPGMIITSALTVFLFGVHWGNPLLSILLILASTVASTALGLLVYYLFENTVATIILVFTIVWFMGFYGGSFETYMFSSHPQSIKLLSPMYHVNRALAELSCIGQSDYVSSALLYCTILTLACSVLAIAVNTIKRRGRA